MALKKRSKIKLPALVNDDEDDDYKKQTSNTLLPQLSESDDENDNADVTIKLEKSRARRNKLRATFETQDRVPEPSSNILYHDEIDLLKQKKERKDDTQEVVLNMEDMVERGDISDTEVVSPNNEKIRPKTNVQLEETKYFKMLNSEDKSDIIDTINRQGGVEKDNERDDIADFVMTEFEDERLALTSKELRRQVELKRRLIKETLQNDEHGSSDEQEWEEHVLEKNQVKLDQGLKLPELSELDEKDINEDIDTLLKRQNVKLDRVKLQNKHAQEEYHTLEKERDTLLDSLNSISFT
ncbi:Ntr2p KNAG_0C01540 [Huiozyma naganishii CBS 8797]|uniref:Uncharacterized protein n=1 Tax=Huiozyma naganishii (strain ATCC MYA-139 / BCRC 22969 / CBS 8797 / KCTC 17520 / NBRC 10181 / NCYC 3082 / Yp74L-3) TaxID=1071383 RepID=J7RW95_HUIN7|nr:hypothetical protein KNAG_0C01540 [Kazachstania naganishii CBS 8797]CCK69267.1 hypothetical protein KNAG_0C01540 [Kazachstania naganishii CBS 8797]